MASPDSVFLVPQRKSSDSGFHRELKVFLRLYVTRFPGERIRNSSEVCRNFCPLFISGATEGNYPVSKEKASCGLLAHLSLLAGSATRESAPELNRGQKVCTTAGMF
jgi:hypothetical protein